MLSRGPARIAQLRREDAPPHHGAHGAAMVEGEDANVVVFDPAQRWTVSRDRPAQSGREHPLPRASDDGTSATLIAKGSFVVDGGRCSRESDLATLTLVDGATFEGYAAGYLPPSGVTIG